MNRLYLINKNRISALVFPASGSGRSGGGSNGGKPRVIRAITREIIDREEKRRQKTQAE